jgi:hypothetical protein
MAVQRRAPIRQSRRSSAVVTTLPTPSSGGGASDSTPPHRPLAGWVLIGVPAVLGLLFVWQIASSFVHTETVDHAPVAVSSLRLEPDPNGVRLDLVLVDHLGLEASAAGDLNVKLREPDGAVWQSTRALTSDDFAPLPSEHLLHGRLGYSLLIPASDWVRAPRRGGSASVTVGFQPREDGAATFTRQAEERFP